MSTSRLVRASAVVGAGMLFVMGVPGQRPRRRHLSSTGPTRLDADLHGAGAADDAGAGLLLRRPGPLEERAQHDDDELHLAGIRRRAVGAGRLLAGVHRRATTGSATSRASSCAASALEPQGTIPHLLFMAYQGTFAIITAALISGAIVERMRFSAYVVFISLWALVVYSPIAHWVWGGGWLAEMGALDFAGGTVVHVNAAVAALVAAIVVGKRTDYPSSSLLPHNVPFMLLGAGLLWFGWFGFNAGSALAASAIAGLAFVTTMLAPAATLVVWTLLDSMQVRQADRGRRRHRDRRRPGGDHAGRRLHQPDERARPRRHRRRSELLCAACARQDVAGRFARRGRGARRRRHGRRAADRRVRAEGAERLADGALFGNPASS